MDTYHDFSFQLQHLCAVLAKQSDPTLGEGFGIGFAQYKILRVLHDHPKIRPRQIA